MNFIKFFIFSVFHFTSLSFAQERLVIVGGGRRPEGALKQFSHWATKEDEAVCSTTPTKVLVIAWATSSPQEYADAFMEDLRPYYSGPTDFALQPPETLDDQKLFLDQLSTSTGVFFTGGDQTRIMKVFENEKGDLLLDAVHRAYESGIVFGGTSAGTAIMSETMIVGDSVGGVTPLSDGLGFLNPKIIVDQHFSQRQRKKRLLSALNAADKPIGFGVDEDTALIIRDKESYEVTGLNRVRLFLRQANTNSFNEQSFKAGDSFTISQ